MFGTFLEGKNIGLGFLEQEFALKKLCDTKIQVYWVSFTWRYVVPSAPGTKNFFFHLKMNGLKVSWVT